MRSKTCILYSGVDYDPKNASGDGVCLDVFLPDASWKKCKNVIAEGNCPKGKTTPYEVSRMVEVVNIRACTPPWGQKGDVKIDRKTKWGNPFKMQDDSDLERDRVCKLYETYFQQSNLDISKLLSAKRPGCWCKPKWCHGDYLKKKIEELLDMQATL